MFSPEPQQRYLKKPSQWKMKSRGFEVLHCMETEVLTRWHTKKKQVT